MQHEPVTYEVIKRRDVEKGDYFRGNSDPLFFGTCYLKVLEDWSYICTCGAKHHSGPNIINPEATCLPGDDVWRFNKEEMELRLMTQ